MFHLLYSSMMTRLMAEISRNFHALGRSGPRSPTDSTTLNPDQAARDGENQERDGLKAVTLEWWQLRF